MMDIELPGKSGLELTRQLRAYPKMNDASIVALTAYGGQDDEQNCLNAGCDGYIVKAIDTSKFPATIRFLIEKKSRVGPTVQGDVRDLLRGMRNNFITESVVELLELLSPEFRADRSRLLCVLHRWAGIAGTLGMPGVTDQARKTEGMVESGDQVDVPAVRKELDDEATVAVGGIIRVVNGCPVEYGTVTRVGAPPTLLTKFQAVEYLRAFLGGRVALSYYRIVFVPTPVCWTEVPDSLKNLRIQRIRWQRGAVESMWKHRRMLFNPRFGIVGCIGMPHLLLLEILDPCIEVTGYVMTIVGLLVGFISVTSALLFFVGSVLFGTMTSVSAVLLEEFTTRRYARPLDLASLIGAAFVENFGYRQMNALWRFRGIFEVVLAKKKRSWGRMTRRGFAAQTT
jgi:CheY-like chemotaxis protein